jgi:hypothetical protein
MSASLFAPHGFQIPREPQRYVMRAHTFRISGRKHVVLVSQPLRETYYFSLVLRGGGKLQAGIDLKFTSSQDSTGDRCGCFHLSQHCKYKSDYIYDLQHIICTITRVAAVEGRRLLPSHELFMQAAVNSFRNL